MVGAGSRSPCARNSGPNFGSTKTMITATASTATTSMIAGYIIAPLICLAVLRLFARSFATRASISSSFPDASAARISETRMVGNVSG